MAKRIVARGMNAALASGEAGVGEMKPGRSPMRPRQFGVALAAAAVGGGLGMFTYHAVASTQATYTGQVAPSQTYYLNFDATGPVISLSVQAGTHVSKGEVLATQDSNVAQANLAAAQAAVSADAAVVAADENPQAGASTVADNQLSVTEATAAVTAAQNALSLQQNSAQHTVATQSAVVSSAQAAYNADGTRYASECTSTATSSANTGTSTSTAGSSGANSGTNPTQTSSASPEATATPSSNSNTQPNSGSTASTSTTSASQEEFCQNLQSTINRDYTALTSAQAQLTDLQSSSQLQSERDDSNLTQSQAVLTAAQARESAAGAPLTEAVIDQAKATLATAQAQVATDQQALQNTKIIAPSAGTVADTAGASGDVVGPDGVHGYAGPAAQSGTDGSQSGGFELFVPQTSGSSGSSTSQSSYMPLITLYAGPLSVVAQIPETDMSSVHIGGPASLDISALSLSVPGTVKSTALDPVHSSSSTTYYDVTISLNSTDARIMAGMTVQVGLG